MKAAIAKIISFLKMKIYPVRIETDLSKRLNSLAYLNYNDKVFFLVQGLKNYAGQFGNNKVEFIHAHCVECNLRDSEIDFVKKALAPDIY